MRTCAYSLLSSCPCYTKQKCETGIYSGTRCAPVPSRFLSSCPYFTKPETKDGSYSGTRCYPKILKLSYLPYVPFLPYPHIYHRSFSVQVSLFVLVMTHCYWVLLRPPTKVGQSGGGGGVAYIYTHTYMHTFRLTLFQLSFRIHGPGTPYPQLCRKTQRCAQGQHRCSIS